MAHVVHTSSGRIRGVPEEGVLVFRGIPYAQPPIGPLRFRPPHKLAAWDGVRDAHTYGPAPMQGANPVNQTSLALSEMSKDCLYLNVWTPATDEARRPGPERLVVGRLHTELRLAARLAMRRNEGALMRDLDARLATPLHLHGLPDIRGGDRVAIRLDGDEAIPSDGPQQAGLQHVGGAAPLQGAVFIRC